MSHLAEKPLFYSSNHRSLFLGQFNTSINRACINSLLVLAMDDTISILDPQSGKEYLGKSFLIPAGGKLIMKEQQQNIALCFLDEVGTDLASLSSRTSQTHVFNSGLRFYEGVTKESELIDITGQIWSKRDSAQSALNEIDSVFSYISNGHEERFIPDIRVVNAISYIKEHFFENTPVEQIADTVHISVPHLTSLFRTYTGSSIRRFRMWVRLKSALQMIEEGSTFTEAAVTVGFCDYAQFSRVFKELLGLTPSQIRSNFELRTAHILA